MAQYTYYGFALTSGDIICDLPLKGAAPQWSVNDPGDLGGVSVSLAPLSAAQRADVRAATVPYKCGIAVERDSTIVWSGLVTSRRYDSETGAYALSVPGLLAYWRKRPITENRIYAGADQFSMVADLLAIGGPPTVPLLIGTAPSGVRRDRNIDASDLKASLDEILEIADDINGFEIALESQWDTTAGVQRILHNLRLGSPRLGRAASAGTLLVLEWPGNARKYTWDEDGDEFATDVWGSSTTDEGVAMVRSGANTHLIDLGYPRVVSTRQWSNISDVATLDGHVAQALVDANGYGDAPTFVVPDSGDTAVGSWSVGDDVRLRVTDSRRFPDISGRGAPGLDTVARLQSATLDPDGGTVAMTAFGFTVPAQ